MKKILVTLLLVVGFLGTAFQLCAQSFEVEVTGNTVDSAYDKVNSSGYFASDGAVTRAATGGARDVTLKEIARTLAPGHRFDYCWNESCIPAPQTMVDVSSSATFIRDGSELLQIHFYPMMTVGSSTFTFRIANKDNPEDYEDVVFTYKVTEPNSIFQKVSFARPDALSNAYPCPTATQSLVRFNRPSNSREAFIKLFDLMGREIGRYELETQNGELIVNVRSLSEGIYFYSLVSDGQVLSTKRLIVSRQ